MTGQAYAFSMLVLVALALGFSLGFAVGRIGNRQRTRVRGESDSEAALAVALEDGLARLKAQRQLMTDRAEASERLNSQIVENLTAGLVLVEGSGRVALVNPAARRLLNLPSADDGDKLFAALSTAPELAAVIEASRLSQEPVHRRTVTTTSGGRTLHLGVTVSLVDHGPLPGAVICLFSDLTSIVEMEDQLRLKDALARLGELTAGLAHEFRNGLATIHGYARLVDPALLPDQYRPYIQGLRDETEQLGRVVANFLNFARPEPLSFGRVALGDVIARVGAEVSRESRQDGLDVAVHVTGAFCEIDGDDQLLRQAFDNLFRNAVQVCGEHGVSPVIAVHGECDSALGVCRISVEDNGPGIPETQRAKVFQPFFTTRSTGTGLGLSIVQKIVLAHNGKVVVAPHRDGTLHGARFLLTFPVAGSSEENPASSAA